MAPMTFGAMAWLVCGGILAGLLNAVVGGGTFLSFPALVFAGVPPLSANATNTLALFPAGGASALAYRHDFAESRSTLVSYAVASIAGGAAGGVLLLNTPEEVFRKLVPWLLLFATLVFSFGPRLRSIREDAAPALEPVRLGLGAVIQFAISVYGGYFGGGMGILMLAAWSLLQTGNIHSMNALRSLLSALINGTAAVAFVITGVIAWRSCGVLAVAATASGYVGAAAVRRLDPVWVRRFVVAVAWGMTIYFFFRSYY